MANGTEMMESGIKKRRERWIEMHLKLMCRSDGIFGSVFTVFIVPRSTIRPFIELLDRELPYHGSTMGVLFFYHSKFCKIKKTKEKVT